MLFKNLISTAYRTFIFPSVKPRWSWPPIQHFILTIPTYHDRTKEKPSVGRLSISLTDFTQRRITPRTQNKRKTATNKSEYSFSKHKNPKQSPRDRTYSSEEEWLYCDFHIKSRLQIKFIVFPTNNQPNYTERTSTRKNGKGHPEVFSDGVNHKIKFSRNKSIFHTIKAIFTRSHLVLDTFSLHKSQKP